MLLRRASRGKGSTGKVSLHVDKAPEGPGCGLGFPCIHGFRYLQFPVQVAGWGSHVSVVSGICTTPSGYRGPSVYNMVYDMIGIEGTLYLISHTKKRCNTIRKILESYNQQSITDSKQPHFGTPVRVSSAMKQIMQLNCRCQAQQQIQEVFHPESATTSLQLTAESHQSTALLLFVRTSLLPSHSPFKLKRSTCERCEMSG